MAAFVAEFCYIISSSSIVAVLVVTRLSLLERTKWRQYNLKPSEHPKKWCCFRPFGLARAPTC